MNEGGRDDAFPAKILDGLIRFRVFWGILWYNRVTRSKQNGLETSDVEQIGIVEATKHFPDLVARVVQKGQCFTVVQSGIPVVDIVPTRQGQINTADRQEALAKIKSLRRQIKPMSDGEIVALIRGNRP